MKAYKNLDGDSEVVGYEIAATSVKIQFSTGKIFLYTIQSAGPVNIAKMKILAASGSGLNCFILNKMRKNYAEILVQKDELMVDLGHHRQPARQHRQPGSDRNTHAA
ncbi:hypothetical protein [Pigmentiphaga aceris]|uniref:hypothetical protein n=1 Tax=Pigmentiphaga aceris TaxID=1940612 RepID=UPI001652AB73|nr:hypothetical protein [Pigmentiphaga aceris]